VGNHQIIICKGYFAEALNVGLGHNKKHLGLSFLSTWDLLSVKEQLPILVSLGSHSLPMGETVAFFSIHCETGYILVCSPLPDCSDIELNERTGCP